MSSVAVEPEDEAIDIERMLDDGGYQAQDKRPPARRKSRWTPVPIQHELPAEERAAQRRAARRVFRLYCFACGRSSEVTILPARAGRCMHCGGTMLGEVSPD